jgi:hypothetical protein
MMELMLVVGIMIILATAVFYAGRALMFASNRQHTITLLKNLDAIVTEWNDKIGSLRVFSDQLGDITNTNQSLRTAFTLWDGGWGDTMTIAQSKTNAVRWAYALSLQGNSKSMLLNLPVKREGGPAELADNAAYATTALPTTPPTTTGYLYYADSFDNPIVLMQGRMPRLDTTTTPPTRREVDTPNVSRREDKLYYFVSPGPDGLLGGSNGSDDIYSTSE